MTTPKEPNFFSDDSIYAQGIDWYNALYDAAVEGDIKGEASTHYTKLPTYPHTLDRIKQHCGKDTRFIYMMRDPVDRLVSHYIHEWTQGVIHCDINKAIFSNRELIDYSKYYMQLSPFIEAFGPEQVLPVFYERFVKWPQQELERITQFLGYSAAPKWVEAESRQNVSSERIRKFRGYEFLVQNPIMATLRRNLVPASLRHSIKNKLSMKSRPELTADSRRLIVTELDQDLKQLGEFLGLELTCENYSQQVMKTSL
jgi:hypothetical protein